MELNNGRDKNGRFIKGYHSTMEFKKGQMAWNKRNDLNKNKIISLYKSNKNILEIAKIFNCGHSTIHNILNKNNINMSSKGKPHKEERIRKGIRTRIKNNSYGENFKKKISATKQGITIKQWKGFKSFEPYTPDFNIKFKNQIRKRDNQICMNCGIHREKIKRALHVHHVNYDKCLSIFENCISLCNSCHSLTQINRIHWTKFFQSLLTEKYGYQYDKKENIIINLNKLEETNGKKIKPLDCSC